ncbi:uncharacterized protein LOC126264883 [Aethina tumida]|uniref:uncharacterized protein LOC126264883 n=1 Tax=Aethina tumida TaxID=116153 RepID=UPI0021472088|nr:uncharacterized protein LOC126264883 [Aethina tumida]
MSFLQAGALFVLTVVCFVGAKHIVSSRGLSDVGNIYQYLPQELDIKQESYLGSVPKGEFGVDDNLWQNDGLRDAHHQTVIELNPLIAALLLGTSLGLPQKSYTSNHPGVVPINPYVALILSNYGRYVPIPRLARGVYGYTATNGYLNNLPVGASYKVYEDK